ncbi:MAG: hypothetical protein ACRCV5_16245, partial [Afipia sp.]
LAVLETLDDGLQFLDRAFEAELLDVRMGSVGPGRFPSCDSWIDDSAAESRNDLRAQYGGNVARFAAVREVLRLASS